MTVRRFGWAALVGLAVSSGGLALAAEPPRLGLSPATPQPALENNEPQKLADAVASVLRASGHLRHYRLDVTVSGTDVELTGSVADQAQREEVLRLAQGVPGVVRVIDRLSLPAGHAVVRVQAETVPTPKPGGDRLPAPLPGPGAAPAPKSGAAGIGEPVPTFRTPVPGYSALNPPQMPPYAWPTYAPYNNFSRVAAPKAYPYNAWPFIGPVYPFPKVPLGWRKVKLEWDDGYWWYGRVGNHYDWWKIRYW